MKKNSLFFAFATLVVGVAMFVSCQKAEIVNDEDSLLLKKGKLSAQEVTDAISWADGTNGTICAGTEFEICISFPQAYKGNGDIKETIGQVQLLVYGDNPTTEVVESEYWDQIAHQNSNTGFCFNYTFDIAGTYSLRYKASNAQWSYATVEVVDCGCEESFSYVDNENNSYTFTYIPAENMPQTALVFTFAQGVVVTGLDGWSTEGATRQKTMDLVACQTYMWTVSLTPDCSGKSNNSNVWTDFKVNDDSKKDINGLANIVIPCPEN